MAGYLNYSGKIFHEKDGGAEEANADLANQELLDISEEDIETVGDEIASNDSDVEGTPGEAVLTNGSAETTVAQAKVTREQVRAQNKETLQAIIDNTNLSESEKQRSGITACTDDSDCRAGSGSGDNDGFKRIFGSGCKY